METAPKHKPEPAAKPAPPAPKPTREAVYTGPGEQVEVEGIGPVLAEQTIPDTSPVFSLVAEHPDFTVRPIE